MIRFYIGLAVLAATAGIGWHYSTVIDERDAFKSRAENAESTIAAAEKEDTRVAAITDAHVQTVEKIVYVDKIVTKEVVKYRERIVNRCELNSEWVRIHNQAAAGVSEDPGAVSIDGTSAGVGQSGVDDADALEVTTSNYHKYHICKANLETLQDLIAPYVK